MDECFQLYELMRVNVVCCFKSPLTFFDALICVGKSLLYTIEIQNILPILVAAIVSKSIVVSACRQPNRWAVSNRIHFIIFWMQ